MNSDPKPKFLAYRDVEWTPEIDSLLGTDTDSNLGLRFGIAPRSIGTRRRKLGIRYEREQESDIKWTKKAESLLGTKTDTQLAEQLNCKPYWVRKRRAALGIPAYVIPETPISRPGSEKRRLKLSPGRIASLGKSSDVFLAKRWGVVASTVTIARNKLGIPPHTASKEIDWTKKMLGLLGEVPDGTVARDYDISPTSVKIKRVEMKIRPFGKTEMDAEPELPEELIKLIGKVPDKQLSDQFRVKRVDIRLYRAFHNIPLADYKPQPRHIWKANELELLGTLSDGAVARMTNIPRTQVTHHRRKLGIAPYNRKGVVRWTKDRLEQLGKKSDQELARTWEIPQREVTKKRTSLGIRSCKQSKRLWTKAELELLGQKLDSELARELGISPTMVKNKRGELGLPAFKSSELFRWKPSQIQRLGKVPDDELAVELGVSYQFVAAKRTELGIPALRRSSLRWTKAVMQRMGQESDPAIAKDLGCSSALVAQKRRELGIEAFGG